MAPGSGASSPFLAPMDTRVATKPRCSEEMARRKTRYTGRRGGSYRIAGHITRKLASRASNRSIPRSRRTGARGEAAGGTGHSNQTDREAVPLGMRPIELLNSIHIDEKPLDYYIII